MPEARAEAELASLTLEEKASLTGGDDVWHLPAIDRVGIGRLKVSDGPSGVRGERTGSRRRQPLAAVRGRRLLREALRLQRPGARADDDQRRSGRAHPA